MNIRLTKKICFEHLKKNIFNYKSQTKDSVGIELEMLPVKNLQTHEDFPLREFLLFLREQSKKLNWQIIAEDSNISDKLFYKLKTQTGDLISFEPGGQIEISTQPYPLLAETIKQLESIQNTLDGIFKNFQDTHILQAGCNFWTKLNDNNLPFAKNRYQLMNAFFRDNYPIGRHMMQLTSTIQVCLDYGNSEEIFINRYLLSLLLAPFASAAFSFSPFIQNEKTRFKSVRSRIWSNMDPTRTGFPLNLQSKDPLTYDSIVSQYLDFAKGALVTFIKGETIPYPLSMGEWMEFGYKGYYPTLENFDEHLSLLFPQVRPKNFLEIRYIDCQSRVWQSVPAAFLCGLLYNPKATKLALNLLLPIQHKIPELYKFSAYGLQEDTLADLTKKLFTLSIDGLSRLPAGFVDENSKKALQKFFEHFILNKITPADDLIAHTEKSRVAIPSANILKQLDDFWRSI